jgi:hypothetical protein
MVTAGIPSQCLRIPVEESHDINPRQGVTKWLHVKLSEACLKAFYSGTGI